MKYPIPPIKGVVVYKQDVVVVRESGNSKPDAPTRSEICEFSRKSRQRLAFVAANTDQVFQTMITLTYPGEYSTDGQQVKANFKAFLEWLTRDLGARPSYLWFLEFQKRGAPHFHLLITYPLPRVWREETVNVNGHQITRKRPSQAARDWIKHFRHRVSATWYRIVGSGDTRHLAAGTRVERIRKVDGAARYAVKYALKMYQKTVPPEYRNVGRFWGCSRDVIPVPRQEHRVTEDDVRGALEGWKYAPKEGRPVYQVLYGVADRFRR
jgi:hypothetical protein